MASLRTAQGPVGLRPNRDPQKLSVQGVGTLQISKNWMKGKDGEYHKCIMQAMLLGATEQKIYDAADVTYQIYTPEAVAKMMAQREKLIEGKVQINVSSRKKMTLAKVDKMEERVRDSLVKFSKHMCPSFCNRRERAFIIQDGELLVYRSFAPSAKLKVHYKLKDASFQVETPASVQYPPWDAGYESRLRVDSKERLDARKAPVYLYGKDPSKVMRWRRAFQLAKILTAQNDRAALRTCLGRATSGALIKGW